MECRGVVLVTVTDWRLCVSKWNRNMRLIFCHYGHTSYFHCATILLEYLTPVPCNTHVKHVITFLHFKLGFVTFVTVESRCQLASGTMNHEHSANRCISVCDLAFVLK